MPADDLKIVQNELSDQKGRIKSLEYTIESVLPALNENTAEVHKLLLSVNNLVNKMDNHARESERLTRRVDKVEEKHAVLREEVVGNRMLVKLVKGLGVKILWLAFSVVGASIAVIMSIKVG